jgi:hypothetical protein
MPYRELIAYGQGCAQIWEWLLYSSWWCAWAEKVLLVHGVFTMGEWWMTQNCSHH